MQHNDDGTHVILPATIHLRMPTDRAGLPVMWLRLTDGKMRRDGVRAALLQRHCAADERGRLHGPSGLMTIAAHRVMAWRRASCRKRERKREWLRRDRPHDRLRRRETRCVCSTCAEDAGIEHRLTKIKHPRTTGQVERMNARSKKRPSNAVITIDTIS